MTENGVGSARKDRRHPAPVLSHLRAPYRIDALPDSAQPTLSDPMPDCIIAESELEQLPSCHYPVLPFRERPGGSLKDFRAYST